MENLFLTFDSMVSAASFVDLSSNVISWVEEHCKPQVQVCIGHISFTLLIIFSVGCRVWKTWQLAYFRRLWLGPIKSSQEGSTHKYSAYWFAARLPIIIAVSDAAQNLPETAGKYYVIEARETAKEFQTQLIDKCLFSLCKGVFIRNRIYIVYQLFWLRYDIFELLTLDLFFFNNAI